MYKKTLSILIADKRAGASCLKQCRFGTKVETNIYLSLSLVRVSFTHEILQDDSNKKQKKDTKRGVIVIFG